MKTILSPYHERVENYDSHDRPFGDDYFNRYEFSQNLTNLLSNSENSLVFTINGSWGEGKTTFIKLWEKELKKDDRFIPIYYDAFSNDFTSDVFISIAVTIQNAIIEYSKKIENEEIMTDKKQKALKSAAIDLAEELVQVGPSSAVSYYSNGVIDASGFFQKLVHFWKTLWKGKKEVYFDDKFDAYKKLDSTIEDYQDQLKCLLNLDDQEKKIVFFIDELDRCRPDFAVEVIEKVKHLFEVPNVNFVLSINKDQLTKTISEAYGVGEEDAGIYLQKFIHLETDLPAISNPELDEQDLEGFITHLAGALKLNILNNILPLFKSLIDELKDPSTLHLTPRSIERIMTLVSISLNSCNEDKARSLVKHFFLLAIFKIKAPLIYEKLKSGRLYDQFSRGISGYRDNQFHKLSDWLKENYFNEDEYEQDSSNVADIPGLREASKIIDIYSFPEEPKKSKKKSDEKLNKSSFN